MAEDKELVEELSDTQLIMYALWCILTKEESLEGVITELERRVLKV